MKRKPGDEGRTHKTYLLILKMGKWKKPEQN